MFLKANDNLDEFIIDVEYGVIKVKALGLN